MSKYLLEKPGRRGLSFSFFCVCVWGALFLLSYHQRYMKFQTDSCTTICPKFLYNGDGNDSLSRVEETRTTESFWHSKFLLRSTGNLIGFLCQNDSHRTINDALYCQNWLARGSHFESLNPSWEAPRIWAFFWIKMTPLGLSVYARIVLLGMEVWKLCIC